MEMERMSFFVGKEKHQKLREICEGREIKMGEVLRHLLEQYIEKYEKEINKKK